jgi:hypothetical protein
MKQVSKNFELSRLTGLLVFQTLSGAKIDIDRANHGSSAICGQALQRPSGNTLITADVLHPILQRRSCKIQCCLTYLHGSFLVTPTTQAYDLRCLKWEGANGDRPLSTSILTSPLDAALQNLSSISPPSSRSLLENGEHHLRNARWRAVHQTR